MVVLVASFGLFAARAHVVASSPRLDSLASREGVFLLNNLLLTVFAFVVLTGTLYPMFVEAFSGSQVGVGRPFFDRMAVPLSFGLLLAMGLGPITPYRSARTEIVWDRIKNPVRVGLGAAALSVILGYRSPWMLAFIVAAFFVISVIIRHLYATARTVAEKRQMSLPTAALRTMRNDPGYWGGQISHLGVALLALGIAISANLTVETDITLTPGGSEQVAGFDITYVSPVTRQEPTRFVTGAQVEVSRNGRVVSELEPRLNQYPTSTQSVATPEVDASWGGDLYLSLKSINAQEVTLGVFWFPFIWLVWVGGFVMAAAVLWSRLVKKPRDQASISQKAADDG